MFTLKFFCLQDPREYLPFLQSLQEQEVNRRKFNIDNLLNRHTKALGHLKAMGENSFQEFADYMVKHSLYNVGLQLHRFQLDKHKEIMLLFANHLDDTSKFRDA